MRRINELENKSLPITKRMVWEAYKQVRKNQGGSGVDGESLQSYGQNLHDNLYKLWNRLSSGSYHAPAVREVLIPKTNGKTRALGIPTVSDRIAQQVVKTYLEPRLEKIFSVHSYGYRPKKSAHQAIASVRENVRQRAWVIDMDIKSFFDEVDHGLLMKAVCVHVEERWVKMYIQRWLTAPKMDAQGTLIHRTGIGTPQGGVISPLLANLYLHYTLDKWLEKFHGIQYVRYADDMIVHCRSEKEAEDILQAIRERLQACGLRLNEEKTQLVYCRSYRFRSSYRKYAKRFDFLGYRFKPRRAKSKFGGVILGYDCAISPKSKQRILQKWKDLKLPRCTTVDLSTLVQRINPILRGIYHYYGKFRPWELNAVFRSLHHRLVKWKLNKNRKLKKSLGRGYKWLRKIRQDFPNLFYHWSLGFSVT